jgi:flagellar hook-length control protein FliK
MDQISAAPAAVVSSGGNRVAIGLHDPTLGWVEIKTQSTAGQIAAALVTSSNQTHQTLTAQLPSLAQFLSDREVKVNSVAVQQQATGGNNSGQHSPPPGWARTRFSKIGRCPISVFAHNFPQAGKGDT